MGKKKAKQVLMAWCWYCEREFEDDKVLIQHQMAKHFRCPHCPRRLKTAGGLAVHVQQVHKLEPEHIDNTIPGRDTFDIEIYGMEGIPPEDLAAFRKRKAEEEGGPAQLNQQPSQKRPKIEKVALSQDELKAQLEAHKALMSGNSAAAGAYVPPPGVPPPGMYGYPPYGVPPPGQFNSPPPGMPPFSRPPPGGVPSFSGPPPPGAPPFSRPPPMGFPNRPPPNFRPGFPPNVPPPSMSPGARPPGYPPGPPPMLGGSPPPGQSPVGPPFNRPPGTPTAPGSGNSASPLPGQPAASPYPGQFSTPPPAAPGMAVPPRPGMPMPPPGQAQQYPTPQPQSPYVQSIPQAPVTGPPPMTPHQAAVAAGQKSRLVWLDTVQSPEEKLARHPKYAYHDADDAAAATNGGGAVGNADVGKADGATEAQTNGSEGEQQPQQANLEEANVAPSGPGKGGRAKASDLF